MPNGSNGITKFLKIDRDGNLIWSKTIGGNYATGANGIIESADGGIILTGSSRRFDPLGAAFIMKFDACMEREWTHEFGVYNDMDYMWQLKSTLDGNYITGARYMGYDFQLNAERVGLCKFKPNGDTLWIKDYTLFNSNHDLDEIQVIDSNTYILGEAYVPLSGGGTTGYLRSYIQKVDINGNLLFGKVIGDSVYTIPASVIKANDSSLIFSTIYFTNSNYVRYNYLIKTDMEGNVQWEKFTSDTTAHVSDVATDMVKINDSTAVIMCISGPNDTANVYQQKLKLIKIDMDGNVLDSAQISNTHDLGSYMIQNTDSDLVIFGINYFPPSTIITPFALKVRSSDFQIDTLFNLAFNYDSLCANAITSGNIVYDTVTINGIAQTTIYYNPIKVYPNPAQDKFALSNNMQSAMQVVVYNVLGEVVLKQNEVNSNEWIPINQLRNGLFYVKVNVKNKEVYTGKFVVNK